VTRGLLAILWARFASASRRRTRRLKTTYKTFCWHSAEAEKAEAEKTAKKFLFFFARGMAGKVLKLNKLRPRKLGVKVLKLKKLRPRKQGV
jgi:hypothetical protein